jgi:hypothetical protein
VLVSTIFQKLAPVGDGNIQDSQSVGSAGNSGDPILWAIRAVL